MDTRTVKALRGSIKKWEGIVDGTGSDYGPDNCPLCAEFNIYDYRDDEDQCKGCPVRESTGQPYCRGTPYYDWIEATNKQRWPMKAMDDESVMCAVLELEFLKSLLPQKKAI